MATTGISVVIPVKGRVEPLARSLASLAAAAANCPEPVEIIVVEDPDSPDERAHRANCAMHGARYLAGATHVGVKRNLGVAAARHDIIFFVDSDCRVGKDLLTRHLRTLRNAPEEVAAVTGPTVIVESDDDGALLRIMRRSELLNGDHERPLYYDRLTWGMTTNLAVKRAAFDAAGGFPDDSPHPLGGEDVELGLRLDHLGYLTVCDAEAVVEHDSGSSDNARSIARRLRTYGRSEQWLCLEHPERRRFKLNTVSTLCLTALGATLAAPRLGRRALLAVPVAGAGLLGARTLALLRGDRSAAAIGESLACAAFECCFDLGAALAAVEYRRPALLFAGFRPPDDSAHLRSLESRRLQEAR